MSKWQAGLADNTFGGMKRIAVFGDAGGSKLTLARELAAITGLPLGVCDELQYRRAVRWPTMRRAHPHTAGK